MARIPEQGGATLAARVTNVDGRASWLETHTQGWVNVKSQPFGAKGDGVTDDTAAIQAAVNAGSTVLFPAPYTFKVSGAIELPTNRSIRLLGVGGGSIITRSTAGAVFHRTSSRGKMTEMDGLTFTGKAKAFHYEADDIGSAPFGTQHLEYRISRCRFLQDATDYAVYLYGSREGSVDNCYFEANRGLFAQYAINTHVYGCHFKNTEHIVHAMAGTEGVIVHGGTALGCQYGLRAQGPVIGVQIVGVMWDFLDNPVYLAGVTRAAITGSYITSRTASPAIWAGIQGANRSSYLRIVGNATIATEGDDASDGAVAIKIEDTDHFEISSNNIIRWKTNGIEYGGCTYASIHHNSISPRAGSGTYSIVALSDSSTNEVVDNDIGKPTSGIALARADRVFGASPAAGGTAAPDANARVSVITAGTGVSTLTVGAPTGAARAGDVLSVTIRNSSGGAVTVTWNAIFKMATWSSPGDGTQKAATFYYDSTNWIQTNAPVTVPN